MQRLLPFLFALTACSELQQVSTVDDGSNAYEAYADAEGNRLEAFRYGSTAHNDVVDFVFVLDNSISMKGVIGKVRTALIELDPGAFPAEARIAFLSTLPGKIDRPESLHKSVWHKRVAKHDPGFGQLVSKASIANSVAKAPITAKDFPFEGCDAWFRPGDLNAQGAPCFLAHSQISYRQVMAEAGLTALDQLLIRNAGRPTFRPGASVNVVFISDTHDPGLDTNAAGDLLEMRPEASDLITAILRDNAVSSIRFHAIAPETECVEPWIHLGPAYFEVADATGGVKLDVCTATDYTDLLTSAFNVGSVPDRATFGLAHPPVEVQSVRVDGESVAFERHKTLPTVSVDLPALAPNATAATPNKTVEVFYKAPVQVVPAQQGY